MNNFIKTALDHPAKIERIFMWLMQTLILVWLFSLVFGVSLESDYLSQDFSSLLKTTSALKVATILILFVGSYFIVWELLADALVKYVFAFFGKLLDWTFRLVLFFLYLFTFFPIKYFRYLLNRNKNTTPIVFNKSSRKAENDSEKLLHLKQSFEFFHVVNKKTDSSLGSELLLKFSEFEQSDFIHSRVIRYYTILLIVVLGNIPLIDFSKMTGFQTVVLLTTIIIGAVIFTISKLYSDLKSPFLRKIKPLLELDVFKQTIYEVLKNSQLFREYKTEKKKRFIYLTLKDEFKVMDHLGSYFRNITLVPHQESVYPLSKVLEKNTSESDRLVIIISGVIPSTIQKNILMEKNIGFICARDESELETGLQNILPLIRSFKKSKS